MIYVNKKQKNICFLPLLKYYSLKKMKKNITFSLNQMIMPNSSFDDFISFAKKMNIKKIEIRNDIKTNLFKENEPLKLKNFCEEHSIEILTINALQKFNIWNDERQKEFIELCNYTHRAGIWAIVLCPLNDGSVIFEEEQKKLLENSLINIANILNDYDLICLIEPLGFKQSSLRNKSMALDVISNIKTNKLKILHDTFHHAISDENNFYINHTGLVHFSGVSDKYSNIELTDDHRSTIEKNDILKNIDQIQKFIDSNYQGCFSFEPFSSSLINKNNLFEITKKTFDFILSNLK